MNIFDKITQSLENEGFRVVDKDFGRPWGGFFVIDESQARDFVRHYFTGFSVEDIPEGAKVSPKILAVAPHKRLSWQYHFRRSEVWTVLDQPVGVMRSDSDEQTEVEKYEKGETIILEKGVRHRLVGLENWGIVAEIWQHTDPANPSDENDIVRLQDDFGRRTPEPVKG